MAKDEEGIVDPMSYAGIWNTLSRVDVSEHVKEKGNLSFLSWAWAWGVLMEHYPMAELSWTLNQDGMPIGYHIHDDGTVTTYCRVTIGKCTREMWLPVMDNRNNAFKNPDARKISDTKMRCMVKCLALFGLGHYIYAGEDLPQETPETPDERSRRLNIEGGRSNLAACAKDIKKLGVEIPDDLQAQVNAAYKGTDPDAMLQAINDLLSLPPTKAD